MKKVSKVIITSAIVNILVSIIKILAGIISKSASMLADGFRSLSSLIADVIAILGAKISKKNPNKLFPEGYGRIEYITNIFIATIIFIMGSITIFNSFTEKPNETNLLWASVILLTIILKYINAKYQLKKGMEYHNSILIATAKESKDDMTTSIGVLIIIILSSIQKYIPIFKHIDAIGGTIIGLLIIKTALEMYKENIGSLMGRIVKDEEIINKIKQIVNNYKSISFKNAELETHGSYYVLELDVNVLKNIKVYRLLTIESEIRRKIKQLHLRIKFIDINISH